jgi:hypothetical protein
MHARAVLHLAAVSDTIASAAQLGMAHNSITSRAVLPLMVHIAIIASAVQLVMVRNAVIPKAVLLIVMLSAATNRVVQHVLVHIAVIQDSIRPLRASRLRVAGRLTGQTAALREQQLPFVSAALVGGRALRQRGHR